MYTYMEGSFIPTGDYARLMSSLLKRELSPHSQYRNTSLTFYLVKALLAKELHTVLCMLFGFVRLRWVGGSSSLRRSGLRYGVLNQMTLTFVCPPSFRPAGARCVDFYYHMYGEDVGQLLVKVLEDGLERVELRLAGDQGNTWFNKQLTVNAQTPYRVSRFTILQIKPGTRL